MHAVNELILLYNDLENDDFYKNAIAQVLKNLEAVPVVSSYELAQMCYVSPATILRLSRRLGYESYSEFKMSVGMDLKEVRDNILFTYEELEWNKEFLNRGIDYVTETLQKVREDVADTAIMEAAKYFQEARHIAFFTGPGSPFLRNLQMRLTLSGKDVHVIKNAKDRERFIAGMKPETAVCVVEMVYTAKHASMFKRLKAAEAKTIYIANRLLDSSLEDVDLYIGYRGSSFRRDGLGIETILAGISLAYTNCVTV